MARFYLTNKAVKVLGETRVAIKPNQGKSYEVVEKNVLGFKTGQHVIFYRIVTEKEIEVVRILPGMMDMKNHL